MVQPLLQLVFTPGNSLVTIHRVSRTEWLPDNIPDERGDKRGAPVSYVTHVPGGCPVEVCQPLYHRNAEYPVYLTGNHITQNGAARLPLHMIADAHSYISHMRQHNAEGRYVPIPTPTPANTYTAWRYDPTLHTSGSRLLGVILYIPGDPWFVVRVPDQCSYHGRLNSPCHKLFRKEANLVVVVQMTPPLRKGQ